MVFWDDSSQMVGAEQELRTVIDGWYYDQLKECFAEENEVAIHYAFGPPTKTVVPNPL